ncbi:MAG: hypothetical protein Fur006_29420 [Coleofasciculaceae cyanobacterium]
MVALKQLTGAIAVTLLTAGCTIQSPMRPISKTVQPSVQPSQVSSRLTAQQEMELNEKQMESFDRGMDRATESMRTTLNAQYFDDSYTVTPSSARRSIAQTDNTPAIVVGQDGAFLGVVSDDQYADKSICNPYGNFGSPYSSTSVLNQRAQYGGTYSDLGAYNPNAQQPPLIIQNGQPIALLTKNQDLQGGIDPDVFFNQVCGR